MFKLQAKALNIGEALVLGLMTKVPTLVKIDEFKGRQRGGDLNIIEQWKSKNEDEEKALQMELKQFKDLGGGY